MKNYDIACTFAIRFPWGHVMIVITGGMGFLGLHVAKALVDAGETVLVTRHRTSLRPEFLRHVWDDQVRDVAVDLRDRAAVLDLLRRPDISGIVHLAVPPRAGMTVTEQVRAASEMFLPLVTGARRGFG